MKSKLKSKFLAFALVLTAFVTVGNDNLENAHAAEMQPRAVLCPCGGTFYITSTSYSDWANDGVKKCTHYDYRYDVRYSQKM